MSIFDLHSSAKELPQRTGLSSREQWQQIAPSRDVVGTAFPRGEIHMKFNINNLTWWVPSKTYLRFRCKLTKAGGQPLVVADGVGPAMNLAANLFQTMDFRIGGANKVCEIADYVPQVDALYNRLSKSKSWVDSVGNASNFMQGPLTERINAVSSDYANGAYTSRVDMGYDPLATLEFKVDRLEVAPGGGGPLPLGQWSVGQIIQIAGGARAGEQYTILQVVTNTAASLVLRTQGDVTVGVAAVVNFARVVPQRLEGGPPFRNVSEFEITWQPPLSIFGITHALPAGDYELSMTPHGVSQYQTAAIESLVPKTYDVDYKFEIVDMYLYVNTMLGPRVETQSFVLDLPQIKAQTIQVANASYSQRALDVGSETSALTVAFQDIRNTDTRFVRSKFHFTDDVNSNSRAELNLERFVIDYAGQQKPSPDAEPEFAAGKDYFVQRYIDSQFQSMQFFEVGGTETLQDFYERGAYLHFYWPREGSDKATRVKINTQFTAGTDITNAQIILFEHSRRVAQITLQDGQVVNVQLHDF